MLISLIVATLNRVQEVELLLHSLCAQNYPELEVIIVDQNEDEKLGPVLAGFQQKLDLRWLRLRIQNLSHARNCGIAEAKGEVIGFPDDDCIYPPGVLRQVAAAFAADPSLGVLTGPAFSPQGKPGSGRWQLQSGRIDIHNVWTTVIAFNLFIGSACLARVSGFDESFGIGARFGSGEETDLVIRVLKTGGQCYYDFQLRIIHPDKALTRTATARAFRYGTGLGRLLRKHRAPAATVLNFLIRPIGGVCISLLKRNFLAADYYWQTLRGRFNGFTAKS
jgi:glycosyltransferase involved in cell wall biosynthesis